MSLLHWGKPRQCSWICGWPGHTRGAGKSFSENIKQVSLRKTETAQKAQKATNSYKSFLVGYSLLKVGLNL